MTVLDQDNVNVFEMKGPQWIRFDVLLHVTSVETLLLLCALVSDLCVTLCPDLRKLCLYFVSPVC